MFEQFKVKVPADRKSIKDLFAEGKLKKGDNFHLRGSTAVWSKSHGH